MKNSLTERVHRVKTTPIYNIGAASRLTGIPIWTLRWVERQGLVSPVRTNGHQRLFSDKDIDLLHEIRDLMDEHVNLAGIRVILKLKLTLVPQIEEQKEESYESGPKKAKKLKKGGN